jgi:hypothetical protein
MGPVNELTPADRAEDSRLAAAKEAYPGWDIRRVFGGYLAVPKDTPVIQSIDVDGIVEKIKRRTEWLGPEEAEEPQS